MNKYQEALDNIIISSCPIAIKSKEPCSSCKINKTCNALAKDWVDTLQELIDKEGGIEMTAKEALDVLKNRTAALSLNHKIGSRDIAKQEIKEIVMSIKTYVIPALEKAIERAKKGEELMLIYKQYYNNGYLSPKDQKRRQDLEKELGEMK